jgi:hypothetical protein
MRRLLPTALAVLAAAGVASAAPPARVGPIVTVVAGPDWNLVAWRSAAGLCFSYGAPGSAGNGCLGLPKRPLPFPLVFAGSFPDRYRIVGLAGPGVARVAFVRSSGRAAAAGTRAVPSALRTQLRVYALELRSRGPAHGSLVGYDALGRAIARTAV